MNIGIITTWHERGAAYVSRAYLEILSSDHNVFIYARSGEKYAIGEPVWDKPFVTWGKPVKNRAWTTIDTKDFFNWIKKNRLDVLIFNEQQSWDIILKLQKINILIGAYIDYYTAETVPFFCLYDFLLCNTKRHYSAFKWHPQAIYIPWGTDTKLFTPTYSKINKQQETVFFHSCGMNPYRKGTDLLVKAFHNVRSNSAKLIIHTQKPIFFDEQIQFLINSDSRIKVIVKEIGAPGLYYLGDIYVYPARLDGIGLTIPEAMASGLPVISGDQAPMNEFIQNGENGYLVKIKKFHQREDNYFWPEGECEIEELTNVMTELIGKQNLIYKLKKQSRNYALAKLNWFSNASSLSYELSLLQNQRKNISVIKVKKYQLTRDFPYMIEPIKIILHKAGIGKIKSFFSQFTFNNWLNFLQIFISKIKN